MEGVDEEYHKNLTWMLDNDITDVLDQTFSIEDEQFGETKTIDLKPGGRDIAVTNENKREYVEWVTLNPTLIENGLLTLVQTSYTMEDPDTRRRAI